MRKITAQRYDRALTPTISNRNGTTCAAYCTSTRRSRPRQGMTTRWSATATDRMEEKTTGTTRSGGDGDRWQAEKSRAQARARTRRRKRRSRERAQGRGSENDEIAHDPVDAEEERDSDMQASKAGDTTGAMEGADGDAQTTNNDLDDDDELNREVARQAQKDGGSLLDSEISWRSPKQHRYRREREGGRGREERQRETARRWLTEAATRSQRAAYAEWHQGCEYRRIWRQRQRQMHGAEDRQSSGESLTDSD